MTIITPDPRGLAATGTSIQSAIYDIHVAAVNGLMAHNQHKRGAGEKLAYIVARIERLCIDLEREGDGQR